MSAVERVVSHATCLGCGCTCDDIEVVVRDERITETRNACALGVDWFGDGTVPARSLVHGKDASVERALDAAAAMLNAATQPLIYLAPDVSCEGYREGVALADLMRATLDSVTSATVMASLLAAQERGRAAATLGEIRNRADLLLCWGTDPASRYPRYWTRYAPDPVGIHVPAGRRSRTVIAVDIGESRGPADADHRFAIPAGDEIAVLTRVSRAVSTESDSDSLVGHGAVEAVPDVLVREMSSMLVASRYAAIVVDSEPDSPGVGRDPHRAEALIALGHALNGRTRCALSVLRAGGNRSGADAVTTWQTGYPAAVDFARGYPRYRPYDGTAAALLSRGEVDAVLVIGSGSLIPGPVSALMARIAVAGIGPRASEGVFRGASPRSTQAWLVFTSRVWRCEWTMCRCHSGHRSVGLVARRRSHEPCASV